ncbi:MAG: G5 domain-containing protein [Chloroflexi bacterium]|nr:G5 domain-containing protein [Chloroflexota bacterium]
MKKLHRLALVIPFVLMACQSNPPADITLIDGDKILKVNSSERMPLILLAQNGVIPQPQDRILVNGLETSFDQPLPQADHLQIQLRRSVAMTLNGSQGQQVLATSALDVGEALKEAGLILSKNDRIDPPAETPITGPLTVSYTQARDLLIYMGEKTISIRSAAGTVGEALAEAGLPLMGLDTSSPLENEAPPPDGQIRIVRVSESISVALEPIPFEVQRIESADVPIGQEETLQPGLNGLAMVRTRIRYEDGREVSRTAEDKTVIRAPQARIVKGGTQVVLAPLPVNGVPYDYWLAVDMYATVYSPCASGTGGCSYGTASGARAGQGIVAVDYSIYSYLAGMQVYIPGYGLATIGDTGGGPIIESALGVPRTRWIDLGFNEGEMRNMTGWVTVYFLAPVPAEIPYFLK